MARMIPDVDPTQLEHTSEEPVYVALRDGLGDEFVVLHSYPWLRPWRGEGALYEGEADFVVLHPRHGLLVLEVKGGQTIRHDGHRWFRDTKDGPREFQDPFRQARRSMHALLDIVKERSGGRVRKGDLVHGYAVVFPHMDYEGQPPAHADKAIVISRRHLLFIEQAIMTTFQAWTDKPRALRHDRYRMLLHDCLMPRFRVFRPIGPDISVAADQLLELTETQAQVFEGLYVQDRVLVEGVAGSGKTFLALLRALAFAREGKRTLFVCYNKELAAWIRGQVAEDPDIEDYRSLLTVKNFHALAAELAEAAELEFRPAGGGQLTQAFWDGEVPDLMEQAVLSLDLDGESVQFHAIVVDEAQDFSLSWWYALTQSLLEAPDGPVYAFMDPNLVAPRRGPVASRRVPDSVPSHNQLSEHSEDRHRERLGPRPRAAHLRPRASRRPASTPPGEHAEAPEGVGPAGAEEAARTRGRVATAARRHRSRGEGERQLGRCR